MRETWNTKAGFIIAAIGSAVGLGNLWRFPYIAASNGGGAFIFPYLFAIITAGIPILILEYTLGKTFRSGAPGAFARINRKFEWLGWLQRHDSECAGPTPRYIVPPSCTQGSPSLDRARLVP